MTQDQKVKELIEEVAGWRQDCDEMIQALGAGEFERALGSGASLSYADIIGTEDRIRELIEGVEA